MVVPGEFDRRSILVLAACCVAGVFAVSAIITGTFGVFMGPIGSDMGWTRGEVSLLLTITIWSGAITSPLVGWLTDRWGGRNTTILFKALFGASTIALGLIGPSAWALYACCLSLGVSGPLTVSLSKIIASWFRRRRGLAMSVFAVSVSLGAALTPPIAERLVAALGWRGAYVAFGASILLICIPLLLIFLRENTPSPAHAPAHASAVAGDVAAYEGLSLQQALRTSPFWIFCLILPAMRFVEVAMQTHLVPMLTDRGFSTPAAVQVVSAVAIGGMSGRLLDGVLLDRFATPRVILPFICFAFVGVAILARSADPAIVMAAAFVLGLGTGAEIASAPYMVTRYFGLRSYGRILGVLSLINISCSGLAPLVMGKGFDMFGSYALPLLLLQGVVVFVLAAAFMLRPYRFGLSEK